MLLIFSCFCRVFCIYLGVNFSCGVQFWSIMYLQMCYACIMYRKFNSAPEPKSNFWNVKKIKIKILFVLSHIQMLPGNFEAKRLTILACARKKWTPNVTPKLFFHRWNTAAPFCMKIIKHAYHTNMDIHKFFLRKFTIFCVTVHARACALYTCLLGKYGSRRNARHISVPAIYN